MESEWTRACFELVAIEIDAEVKAQVGKLQIAQEAVGNGQRAAIIRIAIPEMLPPLSLVLVTIMVDEQMAPA